MSTVMGACDGSIIYRVPEGKDINERSPEDRREMIEEVKGCLKSILGSRRESEAVEYRTYNPDAETIQDAMGYTYDLGLAQEIVPGAIYYISPESQEVTQKVQENEATWQQLRQLLDQATSPEKKGEIRRQMDALIQEEDSMLHEVRERDEERVAPIREKIKNMEPKISEAA